MRYPDQYQTLLKLDESALLAPSKPASLRLYPKQTPKDDKGISVYFAPLEWVNPQARVVIIGITPGDSQMRAAWREARKASQNSVPVERAMSEVKRLCAFNDERNQMRPNLYAQLDHWGVPSFLGHRSGASLFAEGWGDVQTSSLLPYPTFLNDKNYDGKSPSVMAHRELERLVMTSFVPIINAVPNAILFPLGPVVEDVLRSLYSRKLISNPCAYGMLHPSGNNNYRIRYLCGPRTSPPPHATSPASYDVGRAAFQRLYLRATVL